MITYTDSVDGITADQLEGFFAEWLSPPTPETHLRILQASFRSMLAIDSDTNHVIGFINAVSDGIMAAYLPLLEVLPAYQHRGIGSELVRRMLASLDEFYMIDLTCDESLQPFYERLGLKKYSCMMVRNLDKQAGIGG